MWEAVNTVDGEKWVTHSHTGDGYAIKAGYEIKYKISYIDSLDPGVAALLSGTLDQLQTGEILRSGI